MPRKSMDASRQKYAGLNFDHSRSLTQTHNSGAVLCHFFSFPQFINIFSFPQTKSEVIFVKSG